MLYNLLWSLINPLRNFWNPFHQMEWNSPLVKKSKNSSKKTFGTIVTVKMYLIQVWINPYRISKDQFKIIKVKN